MIESNYIIVAVVVIGTIWFLFEPGNKRVNREVNIDLFKWHCEEDPTLLKTAAVFYILGEVMKNDLHFTGLNETEKRFKAFLTKRFTLSDYINEFMNEMRKNIEAN